MFVRFLVMLISNILCCFSILVCCRSLVQFVAKRGEIKQRKNFGPCKWGSNAWSTIECSHVDPRSPRRPSQPYASSLQHLRRGNSKAVICDQTQCGRTQHPRSNVHGADTALRSNAEQTIERRRDYDRAHPWPDSTLNFVYK